MSINKLSKGKNVSNKGFAITSMIYLILVIAIILMTLSLAILSNRKLIVDKQRDKALDNIYNKNTNINESSAPVIIEVTGNTDEWSLSKTLVVNAIDEDNDIKEYSFDNGVTWQESNTMIITLNDIYIIKVKDEEENISSPISVIVSKISTTAPTISIERSSSGSNFIVVQSTVVDNEMGISKIEYSKDNGVTWINGGMATTYTFNGLTKNTSYNILAKVTSKNGKTVISNVLSVSTKNITIPTYSVNTTGEAISKVVTITYPIISGQTLTYEYSLDEGKTWKTATQSQRVTFTDNGTIVARVKDGTNTVTSSTYTVNNILNYLMITNTQPTTGDITFLGGTINRNKIESVTTMNTKTVPSNVIGSWDVSEKQNGSINAWYTDTNSNGLYELYIGQDGGVKANPNSQFLFMYFENLKSLNLSNINTTHVTSMAGIFAFCSNLTSLNVSYLDTSKVTNMFGVFYNCSSLTTLNVSNFDTSKVTTMFQLFQGCSGLTDIVGLDKFNTSNVTDMMAMFSGCSNLTTLNLYNFNTSKVTTMRNMFYECNKLSNLNVSSFDTSKVTNMRAMFYNCSNLTGIDLSKFNTNVVTDMQYMFYCCSKLTSLNVSSFNTSEVTNMYGMFYSCSSLTTLNLSSFVTTKVTNMSYMFNRCSALTSVDFRKATFTSVTTYSYMFTTSSTTTVYVKDTTAKNWLTGKFTKLTVTVV